MSFGSSKRTQCDVAATRLTPPIGSAVAIPGAVVGYLTTGIRVSFRKSSPSSKIVLWTWGSSFMTGGGAGQKTGIRVTGPGNLTGADSDVGIFYFNSDSVHQMQTGIVEIDSLAQGTYTAEMLTDVNSTTPTAHVDQYDTLGIMAFEVEA